MFRRLLVGICLIEAVHLVLCMFSLLYNLCCRGLFKSFLWADSYIEYTMLVLFDIKFIRRDQKQRKSGESLLAD